VGKDEALGRVNGGAGGGEAGPVVGSWHLWNHQGGIWCCLHGWTEDSIISSCVLTSLEAPSAASTASMVSRV
jgi:hypothetical protein